MRIKKPLSSPGLCFRLPVPTNHQSQDFPQATKSGFYLQLTNSSPVLPTPGRAGVSALAMTRRFSDQPESTTPDTTLGGSMKASSRPQGPCKSVHGSPPHENLRNRNSSITRPGRARSKSKAQRVPNCQNWDDAGVIAVCYLFSCSKECGTIRYRYLV